MKKFLFIVLSTVVFFVYGVESLAALKISNSSLVVNNENLLQYTFTATTTQPAQVYLSYTSTNGKVNYTDISELGKQHTIHLIGLTADTDIEIKAHAFNSKGNVQISLNNVFIPNENLIELNELKKTTMKQSALDENVLLITDRGNGEADFAFIMDVEGNVVWYETLPNSNENADCNAINYSKGYVIISDCQTITRKKLDGTEEMTYTLEGDSLYSGSFFHDKAIINRDSNIVSLFAHETIVDKSLIGGDSLTQLVTDGFVEFDFNTGEVLYTYSPTSDNSFCNFYKDLNTGGKWASVFGDSIEYYRLATGINQDNDAGYFLTLSKDTLIPAGGIAKINPFSNFCELEENFVSPTNQKFVFYQDDWFVNPRSFSVLPSGNYFMLTNYPDTMIKRMDTMIMEIDTVLLDTIISPLANGKTTRALEYWFEPGSYMGYFTMFWTVDEFHFPEAAYTELGSAIWLPNEHILGFSDVNNTMYEINDTSGVTGEWTFNESLKVCASVNNLYSSEPLVYISEIDTMLCNNQMEMFQLVGVPEGGYFEGIPLTEDNVFHPDSVDAGTYTVTYHFGPVSASMDINVEVCSGIEDLETMGGLDSYLFPNPITIAKPMLKYRQAKAGELRLQIFDLNGRQIEQINLGFRSVGLSAETINLQHYKSGVYVYRLSSGDMQQYKRFVVAR